MLLFLPIFLKNQRIGKIYLDRMVVKLDDIELMRVCEFLSKMAMIPYFQ